MIFLYHISIVPHAVVPVCFVTLLMLAVDTYVGNCTACMCHQRGRGKAKANNTTSPRTTPFFQGCIIVQPFETKSFTEMCTNVVDFSGVWMVCLGSLNTVRTRAVCVSSEDNVSVIGRWSLGLWATVCGQSIGDKWQHL